MTAIAIIFALAAVGVGYWVSLKKGGFDKIDKGLCVAIGIIIIVILFLL